MSYPEPISAVSGLASVTIEGQTTAILTDSTGLCVEVEHLAGFGWGIELRYDLAPDLAPDLATGLAEDPARHARWRQPFTGVQAALKRSPLAIIESSTKGPATIESPEKIVLAAGQAQISLSRACAGFEISNAHGLAFTSAATPFTRHSAPVTLCEQIMSRKVSDLSGRTFGAPGSLHYTTLMVRFQYPRPTGVVLGLAGQTGELNRNGYRFELYNNDEFVHTPARKPMYQSWPIVFHRNVTNSGWVGIFNDNPSRTFVDIGDFYPDTVTFESVMNNSRVYICDGATLAEVSQKMARLIGGMALPPLWAFGYQQCRWSYLSTDEVRSVAARMREHDIPLDALYFDIDYMDGYRVFTKNALGFSDMSQCIADLHSVGVRTVAIVDPGIKVDPEYSVYNAALETGAYLKSESGAPLPARVWPGQVLLPDFGDARMQDLWTNVQKNWLHDVQLDGIWNDMNEPSNFDGGNSATSKSVTARGTFRQESNLYGYYMAQTSARGWQQAFPEKRGVIITRSGYPGVQRSAVIWHGDNQTWWEHMRLAIDTALTYSLSGAFYTGPDVPGFTGSPPDDLAVRFFQLGAFLPMYRGHSIFFAKDKEPYAFASPTRALIRDAIRLRYSLLREWYSGFERAIRESVSPMSPVFTANDQLVRDQFLLFDSLMVAPVIERDQTRKLIYLPHGDWYELGNPAHALHGGEWLARDVTLATIPVYVRAGTVLARNTPGANTAATLELPETSETYPALDGSRASGYWYGDDGISVHPRSVVREEIRG